MAWTFGRQGSIANSDLSSARSYQLNASLDANDAAKGHSAFDAPLRVGTPTQSDAFTHVAALVRGGDMLGASAKGGSGNLALSFGLGATTLVNDHNLSVAGLSQGSANWDKLQMGLSDLFVASKLTASGLDAAGKMDALKSMTASNSLLQMYNHDGKAMVAVDLVASDGNGHHLQQVMEHHFGMTSGGSYGAMAGGYVPIDQLGHMSDLGLLAFARPVYAETSVGLTTSQDVQSMNVDTAQGIYSGLDGSGLNIGVMSDSFDTRTSTSIHYAQDVTNGDLPAGVTIIKDKPAPAGTDEGRGMAQQAYDVAPGAQFKFYTAFVSQADFATGIGALNAAGCQIIVDDVRYFAEPMFQDGIVAQAVDAAHAAGSMYFSSAGNYADNSYMANFVDSGSTYVNGPTTYKLMDFDPGAGVDTRLSVTQNTTTVYNLQWAEPFKSVSPGSTGATSDLALLFFSGGSFIGAIDSANIGADPIELAQLTGAGTLDVAIGVKSTSPNPTLIKLDGMQNGGGFAFNEFDTHSATAWGHNNAAGAISVGASDWVDSQRFGDFPHGTDPFPYSEYFSSKGGQPIYFDTAGNLLASPEDRGHNQFTASDGGNTSFFGTDRTYDADTFPNFYGTSSAAPNAAAIAALLWQKFPTATIAQIEQALKDSAQDIQIDYLGNPMGVGNDATTGTGLIQAPEAVLALHALLPAVAQNDAFATDQDTALTSGNVFDDNGAGADSDPGGFDLEVTEVEGSSANVGTQIVLTSGALLTLNADGTFDYDPNNAFDYLPAAGSGASNLTADDSFTYTLDGGNTGTVTVTLSGLDDDDLVEGSSGNDNIDSGVGSDHIDLSKGGDDTATGNIGDDTIKMKETLTADDQLDGSTGFDKLILNGDYSSGVVLGAATMVNIELLRFVTGSSYSITMDDGNVAAGETLKVRPDSLVAGDDVTFDGSAETDGNFNIAMGGGDDSLTGGGKKDQIDGGGGEDSLTGGAANDTFIFRLGQADGDTVVDFDGKGTHHGDHLEFVGYGNGTVTQLDATHWQVHSEDTLTTETIAFTNSATIDPTDFSFV